MLADFSNRYRHRRKVAMLTKHLKACPVWLVESFGSQDTCRHAHTSSCHIYLGQASLEHVVLSEVSLPVVISVSLQMIRHAHAGHFLSARGRAATPCPCRTFFFLLEVGLLQCTSAALLAIPPDHLEEAST